ncbi:MAG TPA: stage IV sporulation protein A, partial [Candidatus Fimenecus sp.]|nr:stage IV sporulation protein A [Candidatus Fimenecus sp.]
DRLKCALDEVEATGYGIVMPSIDELTLEEPELVKQGGKYGVKLSASAPSIHMLKANIKTEVAPIVGSESQSEELVKYLLQGFEEDPQKIWESNIFGKSLHELVNEGLRGKLNHMPSDARMKLQETLERVINEGCNGLICIIL